MFLNLLAVILISSGCQTRTNQPLTGHFEGYLEYRNKKLGTAIDFEYHHGKQSALLSIPDNLQLNKPFTTVEYNAPAIELKMKDEDIPITIRATLHQNSIDGKLNGSIPASIHLTKAERYIPPAKAYTIEEVILNNHGTTLSANLYLPNTNLPSPAIIMVAGSGNHTKEEYNGAADLFASRGMATLTFDKRNVTSVPGLSLKYVNSDIASMKDLVSDVETAFNFLKTKKEIRQTKIGVIGFSLGAVEAPVVAASHPDLAFVVAVSGNATTDQEFIINQGLNKYRENGYDPPTIKKAEALYNDLFKYAKTRLNEEALQLELDKAYAEKWGPLCFPREPPGENELKYLMTWNNFEFDPAIYWKKINVPCLVVYGEKDKYIPVERSIEILNKVFDIKKGLLTLKLYANADHTIRTIPGKENFEFPKYADGYINDVLNWLLKQAE
jgi:dienelactone hydrolase